MCLLVLYNLDYRQRCGEVQGAVSVECLMRQPLYPIKCGTLVLGFSLIIHTKSVIEAHRPQSYHISATTDERTIRALAGKVEQCPVY